MTTSELSVADLCDAHEDLVEVCPLQFRDLGGVRAFQGRIRTVRCYEDNSVVKTTLAEPGEGCVLVVDGGGSLNRALVGDMIGADAVRNGWAGVIINGAVRDSAVLVTLRLGVKALGTNPRRCFRRGQGEADVPVAIGGVIFKPGDMVYADTDGVAVLPAGS